MATDKEKIAAKARRTRSANKEKDEKNEKALQKARSGERNAKAKLVSFKDGVEYAMKQMRTV